jgi:ribosomal protein S18 acetylase RimI-like enzyme
MRQAGFRVVPLAKNYDRTGFNCGSDTLNSYFQQQVTQEIRRRVTACFVALTSDQTIAGFYTIAATSVPLIGLPPGIAKKLPRYPLVPAVRMGRLAVAGQFKAQGLGGALLADALHRAAVSDIAAYAMLVDAKDDKAASFYQHHGFIPLPDSPLTLFLPLATLVKMTH